MAFRAFFHSTPAPFMRFISRRMSLPIREVVIVGRRSGRPRRVLLSVYDVDGISYIGHPNGASAQWVRNLVAGGVAEVIAFDGTATTVAATVLGPGTERDAVLRATTQQPFPAGKFYGAARDHVKAAGVYFRLEPQMPTADNSTTGAS
jgi:hypothetical protein